MIVKNIHYSKKFIKELKKLPNEIIQLAVQKEAIFRENPLHPSLRLHELHGKLKGIWSISINGGYRIIFERMENGDILFISVGKHDIYKSL
jgi:addiction module RelE/StbE family toxin